MTTKPIDHVTLWVEGEPEPIDQTEQDCFEEPLQPPEEKFGDFGKKAIQDQIERTKAGTPSVFQETWGRAANGIMGRLDAVAGGLGAGYCAKVTTIAIVITTTGEEIIGFNACMEPQEICPRKPGEDYTKCRTVCKQIGHAEFVACLFAGKKSKGGRLVLCGHTYCCDDCLGIMSKAGIAEYEIIPVESIKNDNRVDRLRLLGNGVVPKQAEKAQKDAKEIAHSCNKARKPQKKKRG